MAGGDWRIFQLDDLQARKRGMASPYLEFLRVPALSCGLYSLKAGAKDLQGPHEEDEVYLVLSGRGRLRVNGSEQEVQPGSLLYVRATSEHSFFEIEEDMTLLVFFASGGPSGA
jgi:mannose-6-phosphate isomerase-like protein (cupin superfamily)